MNVQKFRDNDDDVDDGPRRRQQHDTRLRQAQAYKRNTKQESTKKVQLSCVFGELLNTLSNLSSLKLVKLRKANYSFLKTFRFPLIYQIYE